MGFEKQGEEARVLLRTWGEDIFRRVWVKRLHRYIGDTHQEISTLVPFIDALGPCVSIVSISGGSTILVEALCEYMDSGYRQKLIDWVHCESAERRWDTTLDVISPRPEEGHLGK